MPQDQLEYVAERETMAVKDHRVDRGRYRRVNAQRHRGMQVVARVQPQAATPDRKPHNAARVAVRLPATCAPLSLRPGDSCDESVHIARTGDDEALRRLLMNPHPQLDKVPLPPPAGGRVD